MPARSTDSPTLDVAPTTYKIATVEHWNGVIMHGLVTGGDGSGLFVQRANGLPIFCAFANVRKITFQP
jgi:acyl dehydratase